MSSNFKPKDAFFFYSLSPFIIAVMLLWPFAMQSHDTGALIALCAVETVGALALPALFDPQRFLWAWRGLGCVIFTALTIHFLAMVVGGGEIRIAGRRFKAPLIAALDVLVLVAIPGLYFAVTGRLPVPRTGKRFGSVDAERLLDVDDEPMKEIEGLSLETARQRAEQLLADAARFEATPATSPLPSELASQLGGHTRQFLETWEDIWTSPLREATIGREWLKPSKHAGVMEIGSCEDCGALLARNDAEMIYDECSLSAGSLAPYAPSIYHAILVIDLIYNGKIENE